MNMLVIYDSAFGNTEQLARAMADSLRAHGSVRTVRADEVGLPDLKEVDLAIVGGPTQRHRLSPTMRAFLDRLPRLSLHGLRAAAFDTRYHMAAWKSGSAAHEIESRLRRTGAWLIMPPESFFVAEREGPLEKGELERAARWAREVFEECEADISLRT